jgi:hypothetical protein
MSENTTGSCSQYLKCTFSKRFHDGSVCSSSKLSIMRLLGADAIMINECGAVGVMRIGRGTDV